MKEISALWKAMSAEEKEAYKGQELNTEKAKTEDLVLSSPPKINEVKGKKGAKEVKAWVKFLLDEKEKEKEKEKERERF